MPDTLFYQYDEKGLLLNDSEENSIYSSSDAIKLFKHEGSRPENKFHQCYVGNVKMEDYFLDINNNLLKQMHFMPD